MQLRIATTQPVATSDARENGLKARELMRQAAAQGTRLIHFPEGFLSGYAKEHIADWDDVDWVAVREELRTIAHLAAELRIWVVLGSAHPLTPPNRPHNSLYVIADHGEVVNRYDKRFCSNTEITRFYSPGFEPVVFDVDGYRFGCAICIEYDRLGVDCLLLSAWPVDSIFFLKARSHAAIHNYWLSLSVPSQSAQLMPSAIIGPDGSEIASIRAPEELTIVTLDRDAPEFHIAVNLARAPGAPKRTMETSTGAAASTTPAAVTEPPPDSAAETVSPPSRTGTTTRRPCCWLQPSPVVRASRLAPPQTTSEHDPAEPGCERRLPLHTERRLVARSLPRIPARGSQRTATSKAVVPVTATLPMADKSLARTGFRHRGPG